MPPQELRDLEPEKTISEKGTNEFNAFYRGLRSRRRPPRNSRPSVEPEPGADASAIHGRRGAQVALLQSLILPTAGKT